MHKTLFWPEFKFSQKYSKELWTLLTIYKANIFFSILIKFPRLDLDFFLKLSYVFIIMIDKTSLGKNYKNGLLMELRIKVAYLTHKTF